MSVFYRICVVVLLLLGAVNTQAAEQLTLAIGEARLVNLPAQGKAVMVGSPEVADFQLPADNKLFVFAKAVGKTTLYVLDRKKATIYSAEIVVTQDARRFQALLDTAYENNQVKVIAADENLILRGEVYSAAEAASMAALVEAQLENPDQLINQLKVTMPTQVNIRLKFVEMNKSVNTRLGVQWGSLKPSGMTVLNRWAVLEDSLNDSVGLGADKTVAGIVDALAVKGLATILAEPNLTAVSGEEASFLAGGEFPMPVNTGLDVFTIEYKKFGVLINLLPTVLDDGRISVKVTPEVSTLDFQTQVNANAISLPSLRTRRVDTTVELASGQSFVLGGLVSASDNTENTQTPFLGDIPVLGALFRSSSFQRNETELVVIATAYLVEPGRSEDYRTPLDGYQPANALQRLLLGRLQAGAPADTAARVLDGLRLQGDNGFYY